MERILVKSAEEFVARVKAKQSVSRSDIELGFEWNAENSAVLRSAVLRYADLSSAVLRSADLRSADLSYANLCFANLCSADLCSADLRYADLRSADLSYADLRYADLRFADLRFADLRSADLRSANLLDVRFEIGFSFSLLCGLSFAKLMESVKNCSPRLRDYLLVQSLAHLSAEKTEKSQGSPLQWLRSYLNQGEGLKKKKIKVKRK